jgi:TetR/AcrR family transcriptional regulator, tetracycline repressor protein
MSTSRTRGQRAGLSRNDVLEAAQRVLAERGYAGLSMRSGARELDVAPNALYSHVANKTALVDSLLDETLADVHTPDPAATEPSAALAAIMTSTFEVLLAHADLVPLYLARQGARGPHARRLGDVMLDRLAAAGITGAAATEAVRVLIVYTIGFAALAAEPTADDPADDNTRADGAIKHSATGDDGRDQAARPLSTGELSSNFATGLRWLLDGILTPHSR